MRCFRIDPRILAAAQSEVRRKTLKQKRKSWGRGPESNRRTQICRPLKASIKSMCYGIFRGGKNEFAILPIKKFRIAA